MSGEAHEIRMRLLDRFAAAALTGLLSAEKPDEPVFSPATIVDKAWDLAEMMLETRDSMMEAGGDDDVP